MLKKTNYIITALILTVFSTYTTNDSNNISTASFSANAVASITADEYCTWPRRCK